MIIRVGVFLCQFVYTHCIAHQSASYKCWTFTLLQPTRLSAVPGNQMLPPRPLNFITESLLTKLNRVTSSHRSGKPPISCGLAHLSVLIEGQWNNHLNQPICKINMWCLFEWQELLNFTGIISKSLTHICLSLISLTKKKQFDSTSISSWLLLVWLMHF